MNLGAAAAPLASRLQQATTGKSGTGLLYKAVTYLSDGTANELWKGHAVDKQINHGSKTMADYWIADFLKSDFATTAATGQSAWPRR